MINEFCEARGICAVCSAPIKDRPRICAVCGRSFCMKHDHCVTLVRTGNGEVGYACNDCIEQHHLKVIDPNHPLYLNNK